MSFTLDFNDVYGNQIADGEYEVIINRCSEGATPGGAEYVEYDLIIRNDANQPHKNCHIFHKVWKSKDTGKYNTKTFNTIGKASGLQPGKTYKSLNDLLDDFYRKVVRINVKNEESTYNGKTYTNTNVKYWMPTKMNGFNHEFTKATDNQTYSEMKNNGTEISDEDLPF